jgi:hypothetical protein
MNKYQPKVDPNDVWTNVELYTDISYDLAEKFGERIGYGSESSRQQESCYYL